MSESNAPTEAELEAGRQAYALDRAHVFHSWQAQETFKPLTVVKAEGSLVWDGDGNELIDLSAQLVFTNLGHQHPKVVRGIVEQAGKLCTIAPQHVNDARSEAARLITEVAGDGFEHVFFTNGGADANEHAVRMARLHTGRRKVLSAYRSYHGGTDLAINVTGDPRRIPNDHGDAGTVHFFAPFLYRSNFHATTEAEECERALAYLENLIRMEGPQTIAAIILETIPGTAGIMVPPPGYLAGVRELCDKYELIYIADEVMAGFGRTGNWFGVQREGVTPDLITFAKGVNSGYVPLGGVIIPEPIYRSFATRAYPGGLTYSGHPLACAAAVAAINAMTEEKVVENAARLGEEIISPALQEIAANHPSVGEVRGVGAFWAIELVSNRDTKEPLAPYGSSSPAMNEVVAAALKGGVLPFSNFNRIHVVPALNIPDEQLRRGLDIIDDALDVADRHYQG
ncbi:aspartate aminotransferase family protein [Naumannella sp. ID2617S]|nr:aspartate aminotransferase family protein [Naumannella sp. ID2617S]